jgi:hypothetical protein
MLLIKHQPCRQVNKDAAMCAEEDALDEGFSTDAECDQLEEEEWQHEADRLVFTLEEHENTCHLDEDEAHWVVTLNGLASVPDAEAGSSTGASSQT